MKFYIGITDNKWFEFLAARRPDEVNFWRPGGAGSFQAIPIGGLFLFKLHSPDNYIVGGGFFVSHSNLPLSLAWEAFGEKNGADSIEVLRAVIQAYRSGKPPEHDPVIGCTILANPFFFKRSDWVPVPSNWIPGIMRGKTYDNSEAIGAELWAEVQHRLYANGLATTMELQGGASPQAEEVARYGAEFLTRARLGQGAFRVLVTDAYARRCAITGERTLPVLDAAHIKPFVNAGPNQIANGLLLRSDLHRLFDLGYMTVTSGLSVKVSGKIKEKFENGRDYYALDGRELVVIPTVARDRPSSQYLEWHNSNIFLG